MATRGVNETTQIGNLGKKPELRFTPSGVKYCRFSVACNYSYKDASGQWVEAVDWVPFIAWERTAEIAVEYLDKGSKVYVKARVKQRSWDDKQGGKQYSTDLHVIQLLMLDSTKPHAIDETDGPRHEVIDDIPF